jgi:hypothetical protein
MTIIFHGHEIKTRDIIEYSICTVLAAIGVWLIVCWMLAL